MRKYDERTLGKQKAYAPLFEPALKDEARQLLDEYLRTFSAAPETDFLLKRYFFDRYHYKQQYLQKNKLFIPRADFLWTLTYTVSEDLERTIFLHKRSSDSTEQEIETVTLKTGGTFTHDRDSYGILYTRFFADGHGEAYSLKNTIGAVALAKKLLTDFREDRQTHFPY
ncbi:MAG: hypothetical protein JO249_22545 [Acidobacteria bacterium]|nr:hypothetical protein [Acidobacteriota bacterium]